MKITHELIDKAINIKAFQLNACKFYEISKKERISCEINALNKAKYYIDKNLIIPLFINRHIVSVYSIIKQLKQKGKL
jgi:hypothetical protein